MERLKKTIFFPEIDTSGVPKGIGKNFTTLYPDLRKIRETDWITRARAYEKDPSDFYVAWHWLQNHPIFYYFGHDDQHESSLCSDRGVDEGLEFRPTLVDPVTHRTDGPKERRVVSIWVEVFPSSLKPGALNTIRLHDYECDTGAPTYELAVVDAARQVYDRHGNDRGHLESIWDGA